MIFSRPQTLVWLVIAALMASGGLWVVRKYTSPYASNADASGYINHARMLMRGEASLPVEFLAPPGQDWRAINQQPHGFVISRDGTALVPTYPVGYPLHLVVGAWFVGIDWATVAVNVVMAGLAGALLWHLARRWGLSTPWALAAVAVLWTSPLFLHLSTQPMSDVSAMVWAMAALAAAHRGQDSGRLRWMAAAGLATGIAVLVRPTNALLAIPLIWMLRARPRAWLSWIAGGLPAAVFLAWHNYQCYGSAFASGYGSDYLAPYLSPQFAPAGLRHFALGLGLHLSPWLALCAIGLPWMRKTERGPMISSIVVFVGFYACYSFSTGNWWFLRFLLPAFPAIIVGALLVARHLLDRLPKPAAGTAIALIGLSATLGWQVVTARQHYALYMKRGERIYADASHWIDEQTAPNAVVLAGQVSGALQFYTERLLVRPDLLQPAEIATLHAVVKHESRPLYAVSFWRELEQNQAKIGGTWTEQIRFGHIAISRITP